VPGHVVHSPDNIPWRRSVNKALGFSFPHLSPN